MNGGVFFVSSKNIGNIKQMFWGGCCSDLNIQFVKELRDREEDALTEARSWRDRLEAQQSDADLQLDAARDEISELQAQVKRNRRLNRNGNKPVDHLFTALLLSR